MNEESDNKYLKMCKQKQARNARVLTQIMADKPKGTNTKPRNSPRIKTVKKTGPNKKATSSTNTTSKPRQILNRNKDKPKKKNTIKCTHNLHVSYEEETDRRYCKEGMDLEGASCVKCKIKFGMPGMPPSINKPIWVCCNRKLSGCKHSLCAQCYFEMCNSSAKRRTRK